jgi:hypothetical protein
MAYPIKNTTFCNSYTATISATDINIATGNTGGNVVFNNKVLVLITPCPNDVENVVVFSSAGVFQNAFCADGLGAVYYYQNNNLYLTIASTASEQGFCFSALTNTNVIKTGNFALGVNQGGYGLTSLTAFWNGKPPNVSGYVVYVGNGTSSPTMYTVANDTNLITLSNNLGIGTNYTIGMALNAFNSTGTMVCVNMEPINIVTSGLVVNLDAGFTPSYPRTGISWINLSAPNNGGTLINGPVYNDTSNGGGSISFDGSDDYVTCGSNSNVESLSQITMNVWVRFSGLDYVGGTGALNGFMSKGNPDLSSPNTGFWFSYDNRSNSSNFGYTCFGNSAGGFAGGGNNFSSKSYTFTNGVWYNITATVNSSSQGTLYINGVQQGSSVTFNNLSIPNTANQLYIGRIELGYTLNGGIIQTQLYNRALTSGEVLQNYYAGLQRFIATNNLITWFDGQNTNTRVITPTTAYNMSVGASNYDGTLNNGTTLAYRYGGISVSFDGVDDNIQSTSLTSLLGTGSRTIISWIYTKINTRSGICGTRPGSALVGWAFEINGTSALDVKYYHTGGSSVATSGSTISLNTWYQVAAVYDSVAATASIYVNGALNTTQTSFSTPVTNLSGFTESVFTVGAEGNYSGFNFNGYMSQIRVYSRVLTTAEILTNYTATKSRHGL